MRITILGPPGAGKTTLTGILSDMFNIMYVSSGDLAREHGFTGSDAEKMGQLDPDEDKIRRLMSEAVAGSIRYILDGFPRTIEQIDNVDIHIDAAIYLNMGNHLEISVERLLNRGRPDDTLDIISKRYETYLTLTRPLVDYYEDQDKLIYVNATGTIAETLRQAVVRLCSFGLTDAKDYVHKIRKNFDGDESKTDKSTDQGVEGPKE